MDENTEKLLVEFRKIFNETSRVGRAVDEPEGSRNIIISETLSLQLVKKIDEILNKEKKDGMLFKFIKRLKF